MRREATASNILRSNGMVNPRAAGAAVLATRIIHMLREAGHTAYLVGGCVRDLLLDRPAKDFDVATSAHPDTVLALFPGRAEAIGAHFGVVLVKETEAGAGATVEVATFRSDHAYGDGRHPDSVTFETDPRQDALRRDFTINAMMMDPASGGVLDYSSGRADLAARLVRAVGNPLDRFAEDHLRMLRAVRFAARLGFAIETETMAAIQALAPRIRAISAERTREELARIVTGGQARRGVELLEESGLLAEVLSEAPRPVRGERLARFDQLAAGKMADRTTLAMTILLEGGRDADAALARLRFSAAEHGRVSALLATAARVDELPRLPVAALKRLLRIEGFDEHLEFARIRHAGSEAAVYEFAMKKLTEFTPVDLHPPRLATGDDLTAMGLAPGPAFRELLEELETAQLEGRVTTRGEALELLRKEALQRSAR